MKKVLTLLFALALFSCRPVVNQPTSKSSASDSVELKKQEAWESAHRLDSMGNHREALLLRERTLSEYCPNSAECLQYKGLRCYIENKQDSANFYFDGISLTVFPPVIMITRHFSNSKRVPKA